MDTLSTTAFYKYESIKHQLFIGDLNNRFEEKKFHRWSSWCADWDTIPVNDSTDEELACGWFSSNQHLRPMFIPTTCDWLLLNTVCCAQLFPLFVSLIHQFHLELFQLLQCVCKSWICVELIQEDGDIIKMAWLQVNWPWWLVSSWESFARISFKCCLWSWVSK